MHASGNLQVNGGSIEVVITVVLMKPYGRLCTAKALPFVRSRQHRICAEALYLFLLLPRPRGVQRQPVQTKRAARRELHVAPPSFDVRVVQSVPHRLPREYERRSAAAAWEARQPICKVVELLRQFEAVHDE